MNWRTVSPYMTEDEAWNELADLEMLGIHCNLEEKMAHQIILTREEVRKAREDWGERMWQREVGFSCFLGYEDYCEESQDEAICRLCKKLTGLVKGEEAREEEIEREEKMSKFVFCENCGGLRHIETEPCEHDSTSGSSWVGFCGCSDQEIEEDIGEAVDALRAEPCKFCAGTGYRDYPSCKEPCPVPGHTEQHHREVRRVVEETQMAEAYADYARQEIRFCPYCGAALGIV